jgi:hypothetical protein
MKQYLLLLRSSDFNKSSNVWTSNAINLYHNTSYTNYSYTRSRYGLNLIGDNIYTGIELTSPSFSENQATPLIENSIYVTDAGEVVSDAATPDLLRFVDTSSRIDILAYKHTFTNVAGDEVPTFNIQIYESDEENGPWLQSKISFDSNVIFIRNSKPWIKIELEVFTETGNTSDLGLLFYLEIGIHDITSPVISQNTKNILRRFPTWTSVFEDSEEDATPSIATPNSSGGKFLTALLQDSIDQFVTKIDLQNINNYIASANEEILTWIYVSYNIPVNVTSIVGDGVKLSAVHDLGYFYNLKPTDHAYFYNPIDKQILTIKQYDSLLINGIAYDQYPTNVFNIFDEFGVRVGLPRLFLEDNSRYKKRILDVYRNLPGVYKEALQRTLRRELDIWKVYGATPDSNYAGATPEIIEISDMEISTPYFTDSGIPLQKFKDIVLDINKRYPTNIGYVRWEEGIWDYAGMENEGVSRISAVYDTASSPLTDLYQPGIGDFSDARLIVESIEKSTISFDGYAEVSGVYRSTDKTYYNPIKLDFSWYLSYLQTTSSYSTESIDGGVGLTYEISTKAHANYATPSTFYANLNYLNREDFYVYNRHGEDHVSSPEFNLIKIFTQEGNTLNDIEFRDKIYNEAYNNPSSPNFSSISIEDVSEVKIVFSNGGWDYLTQDYDTTLDIGDYWGGFNLSTPNYYTNPSAGTQTSIASPNITADNVNLKIGSTVYNNEISIQDTNQISSYVYLNEGNSRFEQSLTTPIIYIDDLVDRIVYPPSATPDYLYINAAAPVGLSYFGTDNIVSDTAGGVVVDFVDNNRYIVPSSPNILYSFYDESGVQLTTPEYFESATINFSSTPSYIKFESVSSNHYPLYKEEYFSFSAQTTPQLFSGFIDSLDNVYETEEQYLVSYFNSDTFLKNINLNSNSFDFNSEYTYDIKDINFLSDTNDIIVYVENKDQLVKDINDAILNSDSVEVSLHAKKDTAALMAKRRAIHTGHLFLNEDEYYIYSEPITETFDGQFFSIKLASAPTNGSPVIVNVHETQYRNIVFEDSATPGNLSFVNTESVYGNFGDSLYLAYEDVFNVTVADKYTGQILFSDLSTSTNKLECFDEATPSVIGREYEVTYTVNQAWTIDNHVYDSVNDEYNTYIYFSTTPDYEEIYNITYESAINDNTQTIDLDVNPDVNPIDEGYVYVSLNEYNFSHTETYLSPGYISDAYSDLMHLSIVSYDENENIKPGQTFEISGDLILATPNYVTTNDNGLAKTIIRYTGPQPAEVNSSTIEIVGLGSATPNGGPNSQTGSYTESIPFTIRRTEPNRVWIKAAPTDFAINADGVSSIGISGKILWKNDSFNHEVQIAWNKARTLKDLFSATPDYLVTSQADGSFEIDTAMTSQEVGAPGYWFARVNIVDDEIVRNLLEEDGETVDSTDVTIAGDVIYWYESYDPIQYSNESDIPLPNIYTVNKQDNSELISTPNFVYSHTNPSVLYSLDTTPNWEPPVWTLLSKYTQYQMGIMGTTPNTVTDYSLLHPDHEEY